MFSFAVMLVEMLNHGAPVRTALTDCEGGREAMMEVMREEGREVMREAGRS